MARSAIFGLASILVVGCVGPPEDDTTGIVEQASTTTNGISINGISINGISINGISINGISINGISINGGGLTGVDADGDPLSGADMVGAMLTAQRSDGGSVSLRIDDAYLVTPDAWGYRVSQSVDGSTWTPMCPQAYDGRAVVIAGRWDYRDGVPGAGGWIDDPSSITFGCRQAAIAKCVEMGYRPWATVGGVSLRNHHTACVRMIRGDYCGDGHAWTQDGNSINVYDGVGIQADTQSWPLDAMWTSAKAHCTRRTRVLAGTPNCFTTLPDCTGTNFTTTVLMSDEYYQAPTSSGGGGKVTATKLR
jgi:hypothetical protein